MALTIPEVEPETIVSGDSAIWHKSFTDFPPSEGWILTYALLRRSDKPTGSPPAGPLTFTATTDPNSSNFYLISVLPAVTATWVPGDYDGQAYVTLSGERHSVWEGKITVEANFATGASLPVGDTRTQARRTLDAINDTLEGRASQEVLEFSIEGTLLRKASVSDLLMLRDRFTVIVQKEERLAKKKAGRPSGRRVLVQFLRPGMPVNGWPPGVVPR